MSSVANVKDSLHELANQLPEDATWNDVMEKVRFRHAVEEGIRAADRGDFASPEQVKEVFAQWGVDASS